MQELKDKFFVLGLPRSRTYWLSKFLTTNSCKVEHDGSILYSSLEELHSKMPQGNCDTRLLLHWKNLKGKIVLIDRDYIEVCKSLENIGFLGNTLELCRLKLALEEAKKIYPVIKFDDLQKEEVCKWLFEYLTEERFDSIRWKQLNKLNLQVDLDKEVFKISQWKYKWQVLYKESIA